MVNQKNNISARERTKKPQHVNTSTRRFTPKECANIATAKLLEINLLQPANTQTVWNIAKDFVLRATIKENISNPSKINSESKGSHCEK